MFVCVCVTFWEFSSLLSGWCNYGKGCLNITYMTKSGQVECEQQIELNGLSVGSRKKGNSLRKHHLQVLFVVTLHSL